MSENGPREGTRDLPRPGPDAGRRAIDEASLAGVAYRSLSRSLRRRRAALLALVEAGGTPSTVAKAYQAEHPLEPIVTPAEVETAVAESKSRASRAALKSVRDRPHEVRKPDSRI